MNDIEQRHEILKIELLKMKQEVMKAYLKKIRFEFEDKDISDRLDLSPNAIYTAIRRNQSWTTKLKLIYDQIRRF